MTAGDTILLGRERELEALSRGIGSAIEGRGSVFLFSGEPGIGKTRLADAVADDAQRRGMSCHWGRSWEAGGAPAYWPWTQVMRGLARATSDPGVPLLTDVTAEESGADAAQARFALFDRVRGFLEGASARSPLCILFDDLHAADRPSLLLLQFLARDIRRMPVLLVGTYRDVEVRLNPELAEPLARVAREGTTFPLRRLERDEVGTLLREATGVEGSDEVVAALHRATEGNPLFLDEMVRLLGAHGGVDKITSGRVPLPDGVREVIRDRLRLLSPEARGPLEIASVVGREFTLALVADVAGLALDAVRDRLAGAVAARLVVEVDAGRQAFSHILVRDALYFDLPPSRRAELHHAVATALETATPCPLAELAHHALEAASVGGVERAVRHAERAAARALEQLAYEGAVALLERALAAMDLAPSDPRRRLEVTLALAQAEERAGQHERSRERCLRVADAAGEMADAEFLARAALGLGEQYKVGFVDPVLVALLQEARAALPEADGALRARVLARLAAAMQPAAQPEVPMDIARDAIAMARRLGDTATLVATLRAACSALADFADPMERMALDRELVGLADELGDRLVALRARARLIATHLEIGDVAGADALIEEYERATREFEQPVYHWRAKLFHAERALMDGRFADAERYAEEARLLGERARSEECRTCLVQHHVGAARIMERHDRYVAVLATMGEEMSEQPVIKEFVKVLAAALAARLERRDEALDALDKLATPMIAGYDLSFAALYVEAYHAAGATEGLGRFYGRLERSASRWVSWGLAGMVCEGPVSRLVALAAETLGRRDDAARWFEDAIARATAVGARPSVARTSYEYGRMLLERGAPADRERARALVDTARRIAEELGMADLVPLAVARLEVAPAPASPPSPAVAAVVPTMESLELAREGDVWAVRTPSGVMRIKDSRGMQLLAQLVSQPDREIHVLDMVSPTPDAEVSGDAGEVLDRQAIAAYRHRLEDLQEQVREAESFGDPTRAGRAREEMEAIAGELARGVGLGGRERRASSNAERARTAVQRRLRDAIKRIGEHDAALGKHLEWAVRTGTFCSYCPRG